MFFRSKVLHAVRARLASESPDVANYEGYLNVIDARMSSHARIQCCNIQL